LAAKEVAEMKVKYERKGKARRWWTEKGFFYFCVGSKLYRMHLEVGPLNISWARRPTEGAKR
jgi:hypothetical protein